ncbi:hypothetical protein GCM10023115_11820 [Pontixanthobacter gangjinensis]|uniref:ABC transporter n=1 Tax=Pontixanthobacter gangjinensis TaxID=1028742 RepID=A0A6I4SLW0_9SPHN|nr:Gldg family protein [Pontixanthobacter gangjinensis]MXO56428.1 ABC transporter [Pontixanthobacter gangjinensis]
MRLNKVAAIAVAFAFCCAALAWLSLPITDGEPQQADEKTRLGLVTSLPIYWSESAEFGDLLQEDQAPHWVRELLEQSYDIVPIDSLAGAENMQLNEQLALLDRLALMQPRPLSPPEYVALDQWVNDGGKLLLFADPLLTEHSAFALTDRRRPQSIALISPILERWGLKQYFDEDQAEGLQQVSFMEIQIDVDQPGYFENVRNGTASCVIRADGLVAECTIGKGRALIVSDAALLDADNGTEGAKKAVKALALLAFDSN